MYISRSIISDYFVTPWTVPHKAPLFMEFPRQEYYSRLPFPSPEDLPYPGSEPGSPALQADSLLTDSPSEAPFERKDCIKAIGTMISIEVFFPTTHPRRTLSSL